MQHNANSTNQQVGKNSSWIKLIIIGGFILLLIIPLTIGLARTKPSDGDAYFNRSTGEIIAYSKVKSLDNRDATTWNRSSRNPLYFLNDQFSQLISNTKSMDDWVVIFQDDFEGDFPGEWELLDQDGSTGGEYLWDKSDCRADSGSNSAWAIGGGADGDLLMCESDYPSGTFSWLTYGPFSLADATDAEFIFDFWLNSVYDNTENDEEYDRFFVGASIDGDYFYGQQMAGYTPWIEYILDLTDIPTLGDLTSEEQVWVTIAFRDEGDEQLAEGAYVDNVILRMDVSTETPPPTETEPVGTPSPTASLTPSPTNTLESMAVNLPYVLNNVYTGPTLTPSNTPVPSNTPLPSNTPEPGMVTVGNWIGESPSGDTFDIIVRDNGNEVYFDDFTIYWENSWCAYRTDGTYIGSAPIEGDGTFYLERHTTTMDIIMTGQFTSETTVEGYFEAEAFQDIFGCTAYKSSAWTGYYAP